MKFKDYVIKQSGTELSPKELQQMHLFGLCGEVGELIDAFKKHYYYGKELDLNHIKEELGDIHHYFIGVLNTIGLELDEVVESNIQKLNKRYPNGFTKEAAIARKDKV